MNEALISQISTLDSIFPNKKWYWNNLNQVILKNKMNIADYSWHESVYIPTALWFQLYDNFFASALAGINKENLTQEDRQALICSLMVLSSWKNSQGNYIIDDYCWQQMFKKTSASIVNVEQLNNIEEWTIYIPLNNIKFKGKKVHGFYLHKNNYSFYGRNQKPDIIMIAFNMGDICLIKESASKKRTLSNSDKFIKPMPYAIFKIDRSRSIQDAYISSYGLPIKELTRNSIEDFFAPYFSIINFFGDKQTLIESEIVGPMRPTYRDIKYSLNYDSYNTPIFRYLNPSNIRTWHVGLNFGVNNRMSQRREKISPDNKVIDLSWEINPDTLGLKLIAPHNEKMASPDKISEMLSSIDLDKLFTNRNE
jgi:hypothetical protein